MSDLEDRATRDAAKVTKLAEAKRAAKPKPQPAFVALDIRDFATAELPQTQCAIEGLLPRRHVSLLGAHGGSGKSILALALTAHVACGALWASLGVQQGRAVFVSLEDSGDVVRVRLKRIAYAYGLDAEMIERNLLVLDGSGGNGVLAAETTLGGAKAFGETVALNELREHAEGATLIVVDNASDAFDANENDRRNVRAFMRLLAQLAKDNNAAVLLLAHVDKQSAKFGANGNTYSGSTAWHNSARSRLALVDSDGAIELRHEKYNLGRLADAIRLTWDVNGVLVPCAANNAAATARDTADDEGVLAALKAAWATGADVPARRTGVTTQAFLSTFTELPQALREVAGRVRFWASMDRLLRKKCVSCEEYRNENRKLRARFVCAGSAPIEPAQPPSGTRAVAGCASAPVPPYPLCTGADRRTAHKGDGLRQSQTGAEPAQTGACREAEL